MSQSQHLQEIYCECPKHKSLSELKYEESTATKNSAALLVFWYEYTLSAVSMWLARIIKNLYRAANKYGNFRGRLDIFKNPPTIDNI